MGMNWAEHSEEIAAPIDTCFMAIIDYETFPRWQDAVDSVEVLSRTGDGLGEDVRLFVDAKVRKIDYVLHYRYRRPELIEWDFVEGNGMRDCDGAYTLEPLGPERTRATYRLGADPAIPVPGMILRRTHKQLVERSVKDLKREAERRHAAGEPALPAPGSAAQEAIAAGEEPAAPGAAAAEQAVPEPTDLGGGSPYDAVNGGTGGTAAEDAAPETEDVPIGDADDWVPMAERLARPGAHDAGAGRESAAGGSSSRMGPAADAVGSLLGKATSTGRELTSGAARAAAGAAEQALEIGRESGDALIRRVRRRLGSGRGEE